jgi:hypothetical protein
MIFWLGRLRLCLRRRRSGLAGFEPGVILIAEVGHHA